MGQEPTSTAAAGAGAEPTVDAAARRALAEVLCRPVTGWGLANLEPDQNTVGAIFQRQVLQEAVLAAGRRPPAPTASTEDELSSCRPGAVVTDRDGHPWVLNASGQWCEPRPTGVDPDELLEWAPLTRHLDGSDR